MNEDQANKMIELLEQLVQNTSDIDSKLGYIDSSLDDLKSNTSDLSELTRIRKVTEITETVLKNIEDKL